MPATYEPIATTTLGSSTANVTFSSIAASWTDIRVVIVPVVTGTTARNIKMTLNNDTAANYSLTRVGGNGTTASTSVVSANTEWTFNWANGVSDVPTLYTVDIFSYAGSTYKTSLAMGNMDKNGAGTVQAFVQLWRSTAAITSIKLFSDINFESGSTFTLYGIKAA